MWVGTGMAMARDEAATLEQSRLPWDAGGPGGKASGKAMPAKLPKLLLVGDHTTEP